MTIVRRDVVMRVLLLQAHVQPGAANPATTPKNDMQAFAPRTRWIRHSDDTVGAPRERFDDPSGVEIGHYGDDGLPLEHGPRRAQDVRRLSAVYEQRFPWAVFG